MLPSTPSRGVVMSQWSKVFDAHGVKRVAPNDKNKSAYVPSQEQKDALDRAGLIPEDGGPAPAFAIRVLGDPLRDHVKTSYYRSKGHPHRERRMGREIISRWLEVDDEVLIGVRNGTVFIAKVNDPAMHPAILEQLRRAFSDDGSTRQPVQPGSTDAAEGSEGLDHQDLEVLTTSSDPDVLEDLRRKYADVSPETKARISKYIERGAVGDAVKRACGYRCQICEALGMDGLGFRKNSGGYYAEAHHVLSVSGLAPGSLGPSNVICICPTHHRQLHYGRVSMTVRADEFVFTLEDITVYVPRN